MFKKTVLTILVILGLVVSASNVSATIIPTDSDYNAFFDTFGLDEWVPSRDYEEPWRVPTWDFSGADTKLTIPNQAQPLVKTVWLEISFFNSDAVQTPTFSIDPIPGHDITGGGAGTIDPTDSRLVSWTWTIDPQPGEEILNLGSTIDFQDLVGSEIMGIEVASRCVPEPTTLMLLGLGGLALRRKRRAC